MMGDKLSWYKPKEGESCTIKIISIENKLNYFVHNLPLTGRHCCLICEALELEKSKENTI